MKSSTIRRSNLSKEKMAVLEALSKYKHDGLDNSPNVYVRPNRERELDMLWQNFKVSQKQDKTPSIYLAAGFIVGAVVIAVELFRAEHVANHEGTQLACYQRTAKVYVVPTHRHAVVAGIAYKIVCQGVV